MKKPFTPVFTKINSRSGNRVEYSLRKEAIADYLEQSHWKPEHNVPLKNWPNISNQTIYFNENEITIEELNAVLKKSKNKKAPGPDNLPMDYLKMLDEENRKELLKTFNSWFNKRHIESELAEANIATLYKKGDTKLISNYRPISLLNAIYKLYSAILKVRIEMAVDHLITKTQFGFRKGNLVHKQSTLLEESSILVNKQMKTLFLCF